MFLHDVSKRVSEKLGLAVTHPTYAGTVAQAFGTQCCYCGGLLEQDRAAVEHPDGMNRFRIGLHVPGNVIVSCVRCNRVKRRDDSIKDLSLATTGWESFLSHDGSQCANGCKSCMYWAQIWPNADERGVRLAATRSKILKFRTDYGDFLNLSATIRIELKSKIETLYRECQEFATISIRDSVDAITSEWLENANPDSRKTPLSVVRRKLSDAKVDLS